MCAGIKQGKVGYVSHHALLPSLWLQLIVGLGGPLRERVAVSIGKEGRVQ